MLCVYVYTKYYFFFVSINFNMCVNVYEVIMLKPLQNDVMIEGWRDEKAGGGGVTATVQLYTVQNL